MARFFVNRPIVAMVMSIITVLLGVVAMQGLPIAQYPEIVPPMIQVTTTFIGASSGTCGSLSLYIPGVAAANSKDPSARAVVSRLPIIGPVTSTLVEDKRALGSPEIWP